MNKIERVIRVLVAVEERFTAISERVTALLADDRELKRMLEIFADEACAQTNADSPEAAKKIADDCIRFLLFTPGRISRGALRDHGAASGRAVGG